MKIAYLIEHPGNGGAEEYALNLALEAREAGHDVCFVLGDANGQLVERVREENLDLLVIPMRSSFNPLEVTGSAIKLKKFIDEYQPDIIHTQMLREQSLVIAAKILGAKTNLVRTFHRLDQFNGKMRPLLPLYRKHTDAFIAISDFVKVYLSENGIKRNVYLIHNGVAPVTPAKKNKGLGYLGRLTQEKGILGLVKANKALLADVPLAIGGGGPQLDEIGALVAKNKLKTKLFGQVTDKSAFFRNFNVLMLPSATEALPLVVLEAFSAGTPVVAFDLPALRDLITGENGLLVKPGDYKKLAQTAAELTGSQEYRKYSAGARETYLRAYTIEKMWFDTERLYQKLCQK